MEKKKKKEKDYGSYSTERIQTQLTRKAHTNQKPLKPIPEVQEEKTSTTLMQKQNAKILMDLLGIEQKKAQRLESMIKATRSENIQKEQMYLNELNALKKSHAELLEQQRTTGNKKENTRLQSLCKRLHTINNEIKQKLNEAYETSEIAREKLKIFDELQYWRKKYRDIYSYEIPEHIQKMEAELDRLQKSAKKYKSGYLKLKRRGGLEHLATMRTSIEEKLSPEDGKTVLSWKSPSSHNGSQRSETFDQELTKVEHEIMMLKQAIGRKKTADNPINIA